MSKKHKNNNGDIFNISSIDPTYTSFYTPNAYWAIKFIHLLGIDRHFTEVCIIKYEIDYSGRLLSVTEFVIDGDKFGKFLDTLIPEKLAMTIDIHESLENNETKPTISQ